MEAGTTPWRRQWDGSGGHHVNLISARRYRGANPILLSLGMHIRGSALPYWCGFSEARALGIFPRKGSKAIHVLRPQPHRRGEALPAESGGDGGGDGGDGGDGQADGTGQGREKVWISYRPLALFNAADLEGEALAGLIETRKAEAGMASRPEPERLAVAEEVLTAWPVPVSHGGERACYVPAIDRIQLPDRRAFHSTAALYATWAHEAIHSTGHASRLNRDLSGGMAGPGAISQAYAREELVAELGAVLLGDRLEIGSDACNHAAYLSHWIGLLKQTPRVLFQVLSQARQAADLIAPEAPQATAANADADSAQRRDLPDGQLSLWT